MPLVSGILQPPFVAYERPTARNWTPLPITADEHITRSRQLISAIDRQARGGRVIVLGAGRCDEIPLVGLVDRCQSMRLVDQQAEALAEVAERHQLSATQRARMVLDAADLTGTCEALGTAGQQALESAADEDAQVAALVRCLEEVSVVPYQAPGPWDLVIASGVISQLHVASAARLVELFAAARKESEERSALDVLRADPRWTEALARFARRVEAAFVDSLAALGAGGAPMFVSDSVQMCFIYSGPPGRWVSDGTYRMTRTPQLADYFDERFRVDALGEWWWVVNPPQAPQAVGRLYRMQGLQVFVAGNA